MKKIKLNNGLKLNKEAITKLQELQLSKFKGGKNQADFRTCIRHTCHGTGVTDVSKTQNELAI